MTLERKGSLNYFSVKKIKVSELDKGFKHSDDEGKDNLSYSFVANVQQFNDQYSDPSNIESKSCAKKITMSLNLVPKTLTSN